MADLVKTTDGKLTLDYTVEGKDWENAKNKAYDDFRKRLNIKGFRKGKVPASYVKRLVPESEILERASEVALQPAFRKMMQDDDVADLKLVEQVAAEIKECTPDELTIKFTFTVEPTAQVNKVEKLGIQKPEVTVSDEEVEAAVERIMSRDADWELVEDETPAAEGDRVHITFTEADGDAAEAEEETLIIGDGRLFPDFEKGLIGFKTGETKEVTITYPETYAAQDMRGKEGKFTITMDEIFTKDVPELNDENVKALEIEGVETVEALRERQKEQLQKYKENQAEENYTNELLKVIAENTEIQLPESMIENETNLLFRNFVNQITATGYTLEEFLESSGASEEAIKEGMRGNAIDQLTMSYALDAIREANNIEVSDEEVDAFIADFAKQNGAEFDDVKSRTDVQRLKSDLLTRKVLDYIKSVQ